MGNAESKLDHHVALTGPDLVQFVDQKLFPYLADFKQKADSPETIEYKIGEIFSELKNKIQSGYNLREILDYADELPFRSSKDKHELSHLYETKIKNMGNAGRNGGQYYPYCNWNIIALRMLSSSLGVSRLFGLLLLDFKSICIRKR